MRVGQARKRDANEEAIVEALKAVGATIFRLSGVGCPDLLVAFQGRWQPLEVKSRKGRLTPAQIRAQQAGWAGCVVPIVRTVEEALFVFGI